MNPQRKLIVGFNAGRRIPATENAARQTLGGNNRYNSLSFRIPMGKTNLNLRV
jgi:hypothetical protein